ncbi:MAG: FAD-dependent oxidoreductase [Bryobacteraceae bacterium]
MIRPGDAEYESARRVYNADIDRRPLLIVQCADAADVVHCVNYARENKLLTAVRGGGHSAPGFGTCDGGLVIDLSRMRSVRVDPERRTAKVEGGCTWGDVDRATHPFGLATPGGIISTTGVGGLTTGGGFGYLSRRYGLACDNLISADIVTADGQIRTANADRNADLFGPSAVGAATSESLSPLSFVYTRSHSFTPVPFCIRWSRPPGSCGCSATLCVMLRAR